MKKEKNMSCGHFNFNVRDVWIFCCDCGCGIMVDSTKGQRMLKRKQSLDKGLSQQQDEVFRSLQASYLELVERAGTTDPEALAEYANSDPRKRQ